MQTIDLAQMVRDNQAYIVKGRLQAMDNTRGEYPQYITDDGRRCAIGSTMDDDTIEKVMLSRDHVKALYKRGEVDFATNDDLLRANAMQRFHDDFVGTDGPFDAGSYMAVLRSLLVCDIEDLASVRRSYALGSPLRW